MNLDDFIDLDQQLHVAGGREAEAGRRELDRDRRIGRKLGAAATGNGDEALLLGWKNDVAPPARSSLGSLLAAAIRWTAVVLVLLGLLAGAGAAAALLRYDGAEPINVLFFLGAIVGVQLLLLPLLILSFVFRGRIRRGFGFVRGIVGGLSIQVFLLLARFGISPEKAAKLRADVGELQAGNSLYARVHPLVALLLIQLFGVAFNAAVVATLLFFVVFSDLTFSWGTTIRTEPEQVHRITSVLSAPWAGLVPRARPSLELVEATRFVRMNGAFATAAPDAALRAGGWWPFLAAATVGYGLLPRLLALLAGFALLRREMRRALARNAQVQALRERLRTPLVSVDPDRVAEPEREPETMAGAARAEGQIVEKDLALAAIFWAYDDSPPEGAVSSLVEVALAATVAGRWRTGGVDGSEGNVLEEVRQAKDGGNVGGAAVFFEPFEPPKADGRRFLRRLREALGPSAPIVVFLAEFSGGEIVPAEERDSMAWNHAVRAMGDPFLWVREGQVVR